MAAVPAGVVPAFVPVAFARADKLFRLERLQTCFISLHEALACLAVDVEESEPRHEDEQLRPYVVAAAASLAHEANRVALALPDICARHPTPEALALQRRVMEETNATMLRSAAAGSASARKAAKKPRKPGKPSKRSKATSKSKLTGVEAELDVVLSGFEKAATALAAGVQQYVRGHSATFAEDVRLAARRLIDSCGCAMLAAVPDSLRIYGPGDAGAPPATAASGAGGAASAGAGAVIGPAPASDPAATRRLVQSAAMASRHAAAFNDLPKHDSAATMRRLMRFVNLSREGMEELWGGTDDPPERPTAAALAAAGDVFAGEESGAEAGADEEGDGPTPEFTDQDFDNWDEEDEDEDEDEDGDEDEAAGAHSEAGAAQAAGARRTGGWRKDPLSCERWWRAHRSFRRMKKLILCLDAVILRSSKTLRTDLAPWRPDLAPKTKKLSAAAARRARAQASGAGAVILGGTGTAAAAAAGGSGSAAAKPAKPPSSKPTAEWWLRRMPDVAQRELELRFAWMDGLAAALDGASDAMINFADAMTDPRDAKAMRDGAVAVVAALGHVAEAALPGMSHPGVAELRNAALAELGRPQADAERMPSELLAAVDRLGKARQALAAGDSALSSGEPASQREAMAALLVPAGTEAASRAVALTSSSAGIRTMQSSTKVDLDELAEREEAEAKFTTEETVPEPARKVAADAAAAAGLPCPSFDLASTEADAVGSCVASCPAPEAEVEAELPEFPLEQVAQFALLADAACADPLTAWNLAETAYLSMLSCASLVRELAAAGFADTGANGSVDDNGSADAAMDE
ncbi:hypothetical protein FNF28_05722 [Cafeteria roenbergensis]|uniref:Uncharacterized protein n=3 Tax=Cafeteria roenbergensis TaxID=33653 RepID=A0A5A8D4F0_CAFRO|nr:hypothetical protein FNF28_05722 [Cafeteria roenbergensis]